MASPAEVLKGFEIILTEAERLAVENKRLRAVLAACRLVCEAANDDGAAAAKEACRAAIAEAEGKG